VCFRTKATKWYKSCRIENTQEAVCSVRLKALNVEDERCCSESARLAKCHWQLCLPLSLVAHTRWGVRHYTLSYVAERWIAKKSFGHEKLSNISGRHILNYLLSHPRNRYILEKLAGSQLVKKFPAFYGTRRFITAFTSARHLYLSRARSIQSMPPHPTSEDPS